MYELTVRDHVMIAHSLPDPFFGPAQGLHGATLVAEVTWSRRELDEHGVVLDIGAAAARLHEVLGELNYRNLDEHPAFQDRFSTTEEVARYIADRLVATMALDGFAALSVTLREHPDAWATYRRELS